MNKYFVYREQVADPISIKADRYEILRDPDRTYSPAIKFFVGSDIVAIFDGFSAIVMEQWSI